MSAGQVRRGLKWGIIAGVVLFAVALALAAMGLSEIPKALDAAGAAIILMCIFGIVVLGGKR